MRAVQWFLCALTLVAIVSSVSAAASGEWERATYHLLSGWYIMWVLDKSTDP